MRVSMTIFEHASHGMSLQLVPESDIERQLLHTMFSHGHMQQAHPGKEDPKGTTGFFINAFGKESTDAR